MKKAISCLLALVMLFALCASGTAFAANDTFTIKIACENSDSYPATLGLYAMEKYV